jgi:MFS family permease
MAVRRRILQGIAVGSASGALTAALTELHPAGDRRKAALVSTVTSMGALGLGPVLAGLIAQYGPAPRVLPFVLEIVLLAPAAAAIATLPAARPAARWQPRRPQIPAQVRGIFATSGLACFLAFAVIGLFLTLIPTYVVSLSGSTNLLLAGAAVAMVLACSVLAQLAGYRQPARYLERRGLALLAAGLLLLAAAGAISSLALLLIAAAAAGTGQGLVFLGGLAAVNQAAPEGRRADVLSSFYVVIYLGVGLPVIGVGVLATTVGLLRAVQYFAAAALLCLLTLILLTRPRRAIPALAAPPAQREAFADCRGRNA